MMQKVILRQPEETDTRIEEAIKTLRTNIQFSGRDIRTIMLTSTAPNEGKSEISWKIAVSFAQIGRKTLYIDADIRKSVFINRMHPDRQTCGLSQYLSGQKTMEECLYSSNIENLDVIFAAPYSPNPTELFEESLFGELISYARDHYDIIVIDTAPLGSVIDAAIIARFCDGAIMVIESGNVGKKMLSKTKNQLFHSGVRVLGAVLNKVPMQKGSYYGSYYYGNNYGKYDGYYD